MFGASVELDKTCAYVAGMAWIDIVRGLIVSECRGVNSEFFKRTGLRGGNLDWWERNPDLVPQMNTIRRIEEGLNVRFITDGDGVPVGVERISQIDIDNRTDSSDIHSPPLFTSQSTPDEGMIIELYQLRARRIGLESWEDLPEEKRARIRRWLVLAEQKKRQVEDDAWNHIIEEDLRELKD